MIEYYKNLSLDSLDGEIWVDVYGYDGSYEVSNLGRLKSLSRYVSNGRGGELFVKERILKQAVVGSRLFVGLCVDNVKITKELNTIVFYSFYPEKLSSNQGKEVCHLNKKGLDNKLENLELVTVFVSRKIGAQLNVVKGMVAWNKNRTKIFNSLTEKTCSSCLNKKDISQFEYKRKKCISCRAVERSVLYYKSKENPKE